MDTGDGHFSDDPGGRVKGEAVWRSKCLKWEVTGQCELKRGCVLGVGLQHALGLLQMQRD